MANSTDNKEPVSICDHSKMDVTQCDNHEIVGNIEPLIKIIRGQLVMRDRDLATLYSVETKCLNEQVKRNIKRFPEDFMFQLTKEECLRSQFATLDEGRGQHLKYMPYVFTENGVAMLSSVYALIDVETFRLSHDRFLWIDDDVYHIGASIKDLGKKWFGFSKMEILTPEELVERINRE